jgi:hypothetical protein
LLLIVMFVKSLVQLMRKETILLKWKSYNAICARFWLLSYAIYGCEAIWCQVCSILAVTIRYLRLRNYIMPFALDFGCYRTLFTVAKLYNAICARFWLLPYAIYDCRAMPFHKQIKCQFVVSMLLISHTHTSQVWI